MRYNPETTPNASEWLALPEEERIRLVQEHHIAARVKLPNIKLHSAIHVTVENQIALSYAPSQRALARLMADGLSRHEATHAIGSVVAKMIFEMMQGPAKTEEQAALLQDQMGVEIDQLQSDIWLSSGSNG